MVSDDRGQLILIGAVAIALILVGLVLVVNTALFTEVVGSEGTVETTKDGGVAAQELEDSVSAVAHNASVDDTVVNPDSAVDSYVDSNLDRTLRDVAVDGEGAYVSVNYLGETELGGFVNRTRSDDFESPQTFVSNAEIGYFVLFVDVGDSDGTMRIEVDDGSQTRTLEIDESGEELDLDDANAEDCEDIAPTDGTVRIDLYHGAVYEQPQCTFDLFRGMDAPYDVSSSDADSFEGRFQYVTNQSGVSLTDADTNDAIWSYELEYEYSIDEMRTESERREVTVYD